MTKYKDPPFILRPQYPLPLSQTLILPWQAANLPLPQATSFASLALPWHPASCPLDLLAILHSSHSSHHCGNLSPFPQATSLASLWRPATS